MTTPYDERLRAHYIEAGLHDGDQPTYLADHCVHAASCWKGEPAARRPPRDPASRGQGYLPWIGEHYEQTRLVVVGENFYDHGGWNEARRLITWAIPRLARGVRRMNFGATNHRGSLFQHRVAEYARIWLEAHGHTLAIGDVYDHIAFTNQVKCCPTSDDRGKIRPNDTMWSTCGRHLLAEELDILGARRVVVVGVSANAWAFKNRVWSGLTPVRRHGRVQLLRHETGREVLVVPHPASHGGAARSIASDVAAAVGRPRNGTSKV